MDIKDIPEDLLCHMDNWLHGSLEDTLNYMDGWINYSMEVVYTKNKWAAIIDDIKNKIRTGKFTTEHISEYQDLIDDSGERDNRYLHPIYLSGYIVARARAKQHYSEKDYEKTMSALCCLSFYAGALYESSQLNRAGVPTYILDPKRSKISSIANDATHAGTNIVKKMVAGRPQKLSATPDHFGKVLPHVLSRTQRHRARHDPDRPVQWLQPAQACPADEPQPLDGQP